MSAQTAYAYYYTANASLPQYAPELVQLYLQDNTLWNLIGKSSKLSADGKFYYKQPILKAIGFTAGAFSEGGARKIYYPATPDVATWDMWRVQSPLQLTGDAFEVGKLISPNGSLNIKDAELANCMTSFDFLMALALRGQHTGVMAHITVAASSLTQTVDDVTVFRPGVRCKHTTNTYMLTVASIDESASTVTFTSDGATPSSAVGDAIYYDNTGRATAISSLMPYGMADLINNAAALTGPGGYIIREALDTYGNISRASVDKWKATIHAPDVGYELNENHIKTSLSKIARRQNRAQSKVKWALCSVDSAELLMTFMPKKWRDQGETRVIIGTDGVEVVAASVEGGKIAVKPIADYPRYIFDWVNPADLEIRQVDDPNWVKNPGTGEVLKGNFNEYSGYDTVTGTFVWKGNLIGRPLEHGALAGFAVPEGISR